MKAFVEGNKQRKRTIFLAQNGMLECGKNMKGTILEICPLCNIPDDENDRLNMCPKWENTSNRKIDFNDIYHSDSQKLNQVINEKEKKWKLTYTNGRMKK